MEEKRLVSVQITMCLACEVRKKIEKQIDLGGDMGYQFIYTHEPVSERGAGRIGGDDGLYRIAVYIKHSDGRKKFSHYLEGEFDKKTALLMVSEKNRQNNP